VIARPHLIPLLIAILLVAVSVAGCVQESTLSQKEQVVEFLRNVWSIEQDRDELIAEYQVFSQNLMDMPTSEVFSKADYFVQRHSELQQRMLDIPTSHSELKEIHTKFILAYTTEHEAYLKIQDWVYLAEGEKLYEAMDLFSEADMIFLEAHGNIDELLQQFGLDWEDIR